LRVARLSAGARADGAQSAAHAAARARRTSAAHHLVLDARNRGARGLRHAVDVLPRVRSALDDDACRVPRRHDRPESSRLTTLEAVTLWTAALADYVQRCSATRSSRRRRSTRTCGGQEVAM